MQPPGAPFDVSRDETPTSPDEYVIDAPLTIDLSTGTSLPMEDLPPEALATEFALALFDFVFTWARATSR